MILSLAQFFVGSTMRLALGAIAATVLGLTACGGGFEEQTGSRIGPAPTSNEPTVLRLATSTSTADTGLMDHLLPEFESAHNVRVDVIAVGTGQALSLGLGGDVDVLLIHARKSELDFLEAGHAIRRDDVMYNSFVLLGPRSDPAGISGRNISAAFKGIRDTATPFVSRGDNSGTHKRELAFWQTAGGLTTWSGYVETGRGMGHTLMTANEMGAQVLCDRGTYLKFKDKIALVPLVEDDPALHNPYGVLVVNPQKHERINVAMAIRLADYLISDPVRNKIAAFRVDGEPLFHPHPRDTP